MTFCGSCCNYRWSKLNSTNFIDEDTYEWNQHIWAFDYVEYQMKMHNNFKNHRIGRSENEFKKEMKAIKSEAVASRDGPDGNKKVGQWWSSRAI